MRLHVNSGARHWTTITWLCRSGSLAALFARHLSGRSRTVFRSLLVGGPKQSAQWPPSRPTSYPFTHGRRERSGFQPDIGAAPGSKPCVYWSAPWPSLTTDSIRVAAAVHLAYRLPIISHLVCLVPLRYRRGSCRLLPNLLVGSVAAIQARHALVVQMGRDIARSRLAAQYLRPLHHPLDCILSSCHLLGDLLRSVMRLECFTSLTAVSACR
jgi:hypothetical protein